MRGEAACTGEGGSNMSLASELAGEVGDAASMSKMLLDGSRGRGSFNKLPGWPFWEECFMGGGCLRLGLSGGGLLRSGN